jgi:hypothetical protein
VNEARSVVTDLGNGIEATESAALRLLGCSHRLAYSSFAPLLGPELIFNGPFQPPFPSIFHMQLSKLSNNAQCAPFLCSRLDTTGNATHLSIVQQAVLGVQHLLGRACEHTRMRAGSGKLSECNKQRRRRLLSQNRRCSSCLRCHLTGSLETPFQACPQASLAASWLHQESQSCALSILPLQVRAQSQAAGP